MSKNTIYIIGNGFDMHHSLNTAYFKYKTYLKSINKRLVEKLDRLMDEHGIEPDGIKYWSKLEDYLCVISQFDIDEVYDASLANSENDMGRASYWSDPGYNAKIYSKEITDIVKGIKNNFDGWIQEIEKNISIDITSINIDLDLPIDAYLKLDEKTVIDNYVAGTEGYFKANNMEIVAMQINNRELKSAMA